MLALIASVNLPLILVAAFVTLASPGPSTLAIAGTSMRDGRLHGLALAAGVLTGSLTLSISAAFGLGAVMKANAWTFEVVRYLGACYLLFLAVKSARSALNAKETTLIAGGSHDAPLKRTWMRGLMMHLSNPKAILFFGSLYAIGLPQDATPAMLALVIAAVGAMSTTVFGLYAVLFSSARVARGYAKLRRWFEGVFAIGFGLAGIRVLTARLT